MLFYTIGQGWLFLIFFNTGALLAFLYIIPVLFCKKLNLFFKSKSNKTNKITLIISDALKTILLGGILYLLILKLNFGEIRFYLIFSFVLGVILGIKIRQKVLSLLNLKLLSKKGDNY